MADFPTLYADSPRERLPGRYGVAIHQPMEGAATAVRLAGRRGLEPLRLQFSNLPTSDLQLIWAHYLAQRGPMLAFNLPAAILEDTLGVADYDPTGYSWIYDLESPIEVEDLIEFGGHHDVTVQLVMVPEVAV